MLVLEKKQPRLGSSVSAVGLVGFAIRISAMMSFEILGTCGCLIRVVEILCHLMRN